MVNYSVPNLEQLASFKQAWLILFRQHRPAQIHRLRKAKSKANALYPKFEKKMPKKLRPGGREAIIQTPRDQTLLLNPADAKRFSQKIHRIVIVKPDGREAF